MRFLLQNYFPRFCWDAFDGLMQLLTVSFIVCCSSENFVVLESDRVLLFERIQGSWTTVVVLGIYFDISDEILTCQRFRFLKQRFYMEYLLLKFWWTSVLHDIFSEFSKCCCLLSSSFREKKRFRLVKINHLKIYWSFHYKNCKIIFIFFKSLDWY